MIGRATIVVAALAARTHAKAIITNQCKEPIYVWSVPNTSNYANDIELAPAGGHYEEAFRQGTETNPGIAVKVSSSKGGISNGGDEIDFSYTIDRQDTNKVWVSLDNVRGDAYNDNIAFYTCNGASKSPDVSTHVCDINDNIELVLCGMERAVPDHDSTTKETIQECSAPWWKDSEKQDGPPKDCHGKVIVPRAEYSPPHRHPSSMQQGAIVTPSAVASDPPSPEPTFTFYPKLTPPTPSSSISAAGGFKEPTECVHVNGGVRCEWLPSPAKQHQADEPCKCKIIHAFLPDSDIPCTSTNMTKQWNNVWSDCMKNFPLFDCLAWADILETACEKYEASNSTIVSQKPHVEPRQRRTACAELIKLFSPSFDGERNCNRLTFKMHRSFDTVYLGHFVDQMDPHSDINATALMFSREFPTIKWQPTMHPAVLSPHNSQTAHRPSEKYLAACSALGKFFGDSKDLFPKPAENCTVMSNRMVWKCDEIYLGDAVAKQEPHKKAEEFRDLFEKYFTRRDAEKKKQGDWKPWKKEKVEEMYPKHPAKRVWQEGEKTICY